MLLRVGGKRRAERKERFTPSMRDPSVPQEETQVSHTLVGGYNKTYVSHQHAAAFELSCNSRRRMVINSQRM